MAKYLKLTFMIVSSSLVLTIFTAYYSCLSEIFTALFTNPTHPSPSTSCSS